MDSDGKQPFVMRAPKKAFIHRLNSQPNLKSVGSPASCSVPSVESPFSAGSPFSPQSVTSPPSVQSLFPTSPSEDFPNPPSLDFTNPPSLDFTNPSSLDFTNPPSVDFTNPPSVDFTNPPSVDFTNPPSVDCTNPPSVDFPNPSSVDSSFNSPSLGAASLAHPYINAPALDLSFQSVKSSVNASNETLAVTVPSSLASKNSPSAKSSVRSPEHLVTVPTDSSLAKSHSRSSRVSLSAASPASSITKMPVSPSPTELSSEIRVNSMSSPHMLDDVQTIKYRLHSMSPKARVYMEEQYAQQQNNHKLQQNEAELLISAAQAKPDVLYPASESEVLDLMAHTTRDAGHSPELESHYSMAPTSKMGFTPPKDLPPPRQKADTPTRGLRRASERSDSMCSEKEVKCSPGKETPQRQRSITEELHTCQVCSDMAAGFHCGAYVCEACKKFFVRCLKQEAGEKFVCSRNQACVITKETRTQCQHCRFQKCISLGMYKPGTWPGSDLNAEISNIPCKVCGASSSGYHFGAITCEGCKGFFRRTVKERDGIRYSCSRDGNCNITIATRNTCKFCRYNKCLQVGMTPDGSRIGRQPNAIKHKTMLELKQLHSEGSLLPARVIVKEEPLWDADSSNLDKLTSKSSPAAQLLDTTSPQLPLQPHHQLHPPSYKRKQSAKRSTSFDNYPHSTHPQHQHFSADIDLSHLTADTHQSLSFRPDVGQSDADSYKPNHTNISTTVPELVQSSDPYDFDNQVPSLYSHSQNHINSISQQNSCSRNLHSRDTSRVSLQNSLPHTEPQLPSYSPPSERAMAVQNQESPPAVNLTSPVLQPRTMLQDSATQVDLCTTWGSHGRPSPPAISLPSLTNYQPSFSHSQPSPLTNSHSSSFSHSQQSPPTQNQPSPPIQGHPSPLTQDQSSTPIQVHHDKAPVSGKHTTDEVNCLASKRACFFSSSQMASDICAALFELEPIVTPAKDRKPCVTAGMTQTEVWDAMMAQFIHSAHSTIKFAKKIPGFRDLPVTVQITKVQSAMYQIVLAMLSTKYDVQTNKYLYFSFSKEEELLIIEKFPQFEPLPGHFQNMGLSLKRLNPDNTEVALLCALCLFMEDYYGEPASEKGVNESEICLHIWKALEDYCKHKCGEQTERHAQILACVKELQRMNMEHTRCVIAIKMSIPELSIPQLYEETFLSI